MKLFNELQTTIEIENYFYKMPCLPMQHKIEYIWSSELLFEVLVLQFLFYPTKAYFRFLFCIHLTLLF